MYFFFLRVQKFSHYCKHIYCEHVMCANINTTTTITKRVVYKVQEKWLDISTYCEWNKLFYINQEKSWRFVLLVYLSTTGGHMRITHYSRETQTPVNCQCIKHFSQINTIFIPAKKLLCCAWKKKRKKKVFRFFLHFLKQFKVLL